MILDSLLSMLLSLSLIWHQYFFSINALCRFKIDWLLGYLTKAYQLLRIAICLRQGTNSWEFCWSTNAGNTICATRNYCFTSPIWQRVRWRCPSGPKEIPKLGEIWTRDDGQPLTTAPPRAALDWRWNQDCPFKVVRQVVCILFHHVWSKISLLIIKWLSQRLKKQATYNVSLYTIR